MKLAVVTGTVTSTEKLPAYQSRKLLYVQPLSPDGAPQGASTMAVDYVGAGVGDTVLLGAAPGLAESVFQLKKAPINELVMGIVDQAHISGVPTVGNDFVR